MIYLSIIDCKISENFILLNNPLKILRYLDLSFNLIESLYFLNKILSENLNYLNISSTKITILESYHFQNYLNLIELILLDCKIDNIELNSLNILQKLKVLKYSFGKITIKTLLRLKNLKHFYGSEFYLCCFFKINLNRFETCETNQKVYSCSRILDSLLMKILCWLIGLIGILLNIISFSYTILFVKKSQLYHLMLSFGDFSMSTYILGLAIFDLVYSNENEKDFYNWRESKFCQSLGTIMTFSLLLSIISMAMITFERHQVITKPFKRKKIIKYSKLICFLIIIFLLMLSCVPFFYDYVNFFL